MSAVSYANVATGSTSPATPEQTPSPNAKIEDQSTILTNPDADALDLNDSKDQDQLPSPKASPRPEAKKQVNLAPAPVPEVNAWGSAVSSRSNSNLSNADLKFWPSPNELPEGTTSINTQISKPRLNMVKTSKEKWVPFKASVVLASSNTNKPNKNQKRNAKVASPNQQLTASSHNNKDAKKKKNKAEKKPKDASELKKEDEQQKEACELSEVGQTDAKPIEQESQAQQEQTLQQNQHDQQNQQQHTIHQQKQHPKQHHNSHNNFHPQQQQNQFSLQQNGGHQQRPPRHYNNNTRRFNNPKYNNNGFNRSQHPNVPFTAFPRHHNNFNRPFNYNPQFNMSSQDTLQSLIKQVEYYFSVENLVKDVFLRKQMNSQGWLPLQIIASFHRMNVLSFGDYNLIRKSIDELAAAGSLQIAEFDNDVLKIRVSEGWEKWVLPVEIRDETGKDESEFVKMIKREKDASNTPVEQLQDEISAVAATPVEATEATETD